MSESSDSDNEGVYAIPHQHKQQQQQEQYQNHIINPILNTTNVDIDFRLNSQTDESVSVTAAAETGFANMLRHGLTQKKRLTDSDLIYHACRVNLLGTNHPFQSSGTSPMQRSIHPSIHIYSYDINLSIHPSIHQIISLHHMRFVSYHPFIYIIIINIMHHYLHYHNKHPHHYLISSSNYSVGGSWILPTTRPACLKPMLHKQQYREFAELINKAMSWQYLSYDMLSFYLITLIVPPLSAYYMVIPHQRCIESQLLILQS